MNLPILLGGSPAVTGVTMPEVTNLLNDTTYPKATIDATVGALQVALASKADKIVAAQGWARADSLYSDGATVNRCAYWPLAAAGSLAGQTVTLRFEGYVPTANPSANVTIAGLCASPSSSPYDQNNACSVVFGTAGNLAIRQCGANYLNDRRELSWAGFRATYSGQWIRGVVIFNTADTTTTPTIEIGTFDVSANFAPTTAGATPPNWMPTTLIATYYVAGFATPAGRFAPHLPILGTTTKAERDQWITTGIGPDWWELGTGNAANRVTLIAVNGGSGGLSGSGDPTTPTGWTLTGTKAGSSFWQLNYAMLAGRKYRTSFTAAGTPLSYFDGRGFTATVSGSTTFETGPITNAAMYFYPTAGDGTVISTTISNLSIQDLGPIAKPGWQPGTYQAARDLGDNSIDGYITGGIALSGDMKRRPQARYKNVNVGTAAYLGTASDQLFSGWDVDCVQITNNGASSSVDVKVQLSDGTNHTDLFPIVTIAAGATALFYPTVGGFDTRRRLRAVATSGADNLTFNFSLRRRA